MERIFDILFSVLALTLLSPVLFLVGLTLKFTGEGEIFFLQERVGRGGNAFKLIKFATMLKDSPNLGTGTVTMKGDARILPFGKILRSSKINELPQLLNVLLGDMAVIGPRPLTSQTFSAYPVAVQEVIKSVRPGLSGVGSIVFREEEEIMDGPFASVEFYECVIAPYKGSLEEWFVANKGLYLYFLSIFITVWAVLIPSSAIVWRLYRGLPKPPEELIASLRFPADN